MVCAEKEEGGCGGVAQVAILGVVHVNSGHATRRKIDNGGASDIIVHKRQSGLDMPRTRVLISIVTYIVFSGQLEREAAE